MPEVLKILLLILSGIVVGSVIGYFIRVILHDKNLQKAKELYSNIIESGKKEAELTKKEYIAEAKKEIYEFKKEQEIIVKEQENIVKEKKRDVENSERKVALREEQSNNRSLNLDKREESLNSKESKIEESKLYYANLNSKLEETIKKEETKLYEIASLSESDAKSIIMDKVKKDISQEIYNFIQDEETRAKDTAKAKSVDILVDAMQKYAGETTTERTVSIVTLPNDEIKGKIIGRDGRNIRSFESLTGVDLIIDDTPATIVLSGFDPIRREIAKRSMDYLVNSGRINAARIEEICEKSKQEVNTFIREKGEEALFKVNIGKVHPDLIKLIGRLHFRTSYGQNVLSHSVEMAFLAGKLASEIGENEVLARRAALFHDIGKAVDHEIEGSHVEIGLRLMEKYNEPKEVIDSIASHHGDKEPESIIAVLVATADTLSAGRPGARYQDNEDYIQRITQLEDVANSIDGVEKSFAVQAGREIRVIVKPDLVDDASTFKIARQIKEAIESKLTYPGNIKVTVIRETRVTEIAK